MKIAVLSDIHGNVPALEAVFDDLEQWRPDQVIFNGDVVNRGPYSLRGLQCIHKHYPSAHLLKGNHENFVLSCAETPQNPDTPEFDLYRFTHWTANTLGQTVEDIRLWPDHLDLTELEDGSTFHITHGSRLGNRSGIEAETPDEELAAKLGAPCDLFIASHTHKPLVRRFNGTLVVNTGSVGQPFDGDPRASYGRLSYSRSRWCAEIARVDYNQQSALQDFAESGFLEQGGPLARLIHREIRLSQMHLGRWMTRYLARIKSSEITVTEAVDEYLASL